MDRSAGCTLSESILPDIASQREDMNSSALSDMYRCFILVFGLFLCQTVFFAFFFINVVLYWYKIIFVRFTLLKSSDTSQPSLITILYPIL